MQRASTSFSAGKEAFDLTQDQAVQWGRVRFMTSPHSYSHGEVAIGQDDLCLEYHRSRVDGVAT